MPPLISLVIGSRLSWEIYKELNWLGIITFIDICVIIFFWLENILNLYEVRDKGVEDGRD